MLSFLSRGALSLAVLSLLSGSAAAEVLSQLAAVPQGWKLSNTPAGKESIRLQIALLQSDPDGFEQAVLDMSTPGHANYGKHFRSHTEMKRMLLPRGSTVNAVRDWLQAAGITDIEQDADWVTFHTDVETANHLLDADFRWYQSTVKSLRRLRTLSYSVPDAIAPHVNMIQPTTRFGQIRPSGSTHVSRPMKEADIKATLADKQDCNNIITPQCLKDLYNIGDYKAEPGKSHVAFASFLEEYARYKDFDLFQDKFFPSSAKKQNFSVIQYNNGLNDQNAAGDSGEANLDAQYILAVSSPAKITEFSTGGRGKLIPDADQPDPSNNQNEPYLEFLQNVVKMKDRDLPKVISTSYGEDEQSIPRDYANTVCDLYKQLGSRGVSILFSSGDSGVGSACVTNDGKNTTHFPPQFPAACPWVTSVGGTYKTNPEQAVYFSSGGFSDYWKRPSYQDAAVTKFLRKNGNAFKGLFNAKGRAFPDVAAQGVNFAVYDKGRLVTVDGTSASAPAFAGVIALLNDARLRDKQPTMGFLNPFLYGKGLEGLNDITVGGSKGCDGNARFGGKPNGSPVVPYASWNATKGWDPVTGLGTPNFGKLKDLAC